MPARVPGDALVFTKRIGTGVISTALKQGIAKESDVDAAVQSMLKLNRDACEAMLAFDVHGCTDVTGFGLIGHAREMALASNVTHRDRSAGGAVPARRGGICAARRDSRAGSKIIGSLRRRAWKGTSEFDDLLYDPQTSGGLLIALPERDAALLEKKMPDAYRIGQVTERAGKPIRLL